MIFHEKMSAGLIVAIVLCAAGTGCEVLVKAGVPGLEGYVKKDPAKVAQEKSYRENFVVHRDPAAFYWLLSHRISNGMVMSDVEEALGEQGEFTNEFSNLKGDGLYQTTDAAYRWGPDSQGRSAILFFRDGHLVNFNAKDFVESKGPKIPDEEDES